MPMPMQGGADETWTGISQTQAFSDPGLPSQPDKPTPTSQSQTTETEDSIANKKPQGCLKRQSATTNNNHSLTRL
tara:strand:- start:379 stop:603 length:225 start_codon:yes stop_codon:yes gene_type:complete